MNALYKIGLKEMGTHVKASFTPYDITITADTMENAVMLMRESMIGEGIKRRDFSGATLKDESDGAPCYLYIDMEREFRIRNTSVVRKNITVPEWIDFSLREMGVGSSELFQRAAIEYINRHELAAARKITSVEELEEMVPSEILEQYIMKRLRGGKQ